MSSITHIKGWIESDGYEHEYNEKIINEFEYDDNFISMFCIPSNTGNKNPEYILFGASINYLNIDEWCKKYFEFINKIKGFSVIAFIEYADGEKYWVISCSLSRKGGIINKKEFYFRESYELYDEDYDSDDSKHGLEFNLLAYLIRGGKPTEVI
jgi:hypothetical protein